MSSDRKIKTSKTAMYHTEQIHLSPFYEERTFQSGRLRLNVKQYLFVHKSSLHRHPFYTFGI